MLSTTARTARGARRLQYQSSLASGSVSPSAIIAVSLQQQRAFCFGSWKARSGYRGFRYRSVESVSNRRLSWDNSQQDDNTKPLNKKHIVLPTKPSADSHPGSNYAKVEDIKSWSDDLSGIRPGRNIEDVEREAINHLFGDRSGHEHEHWRSPLSSIRDVFMKSHRAAKEVTPEEVIHVTASAEPDTTRIDPITNRRVSSLPNGFSTMDAFKPKSNNIDEPVSQPADSSQSPETTKHSVTEGFSTMEAFTPKVTSTEELQSSDSITDTHKYGPQTWNEPNGLPGSAPEEQSKQYNDLNKYGSVQWNEPDGLQEPTAEEKSKHYSDLDKYRTSTTNDSEAPRILSQEELSKVYKDLGKYKPASWNEPDGKRELSPEEKSKSYQDLDSYGAVEWNEPDGLPRATREELSKKYGDLQSYGSVQWNEPNGLRNPTAEELSKNYEDLGQYKPVHWNEPDGLPKPTAEEASKAYRDLGEYGAVRWNEPDGLRQLTPEEESKQYNDIHQYKPVTWNEPDGLRNLTPEEKSKDYGDLKEYSAPFVAETSILDEYAKSQLDTTPRGKVLPPKVEVASENPAKEYKDLGKYGPVHWNEPDGLRPLTPEELSKNYDDLHLYGAVKWNEPDGLPSPTPEELSKQYKDVDAYAQKGPGSPEVVTERVHPEEVSKNYTDLGAYGAVRWNEPDGRPQPTPEEKSKDYTDLPEYSAQGVHFEEVVARKHPEELTKAYKDLGEYDRFENDTTSSKIHPEEASKQYNDLDKYNPHVFDSPSMIYPIHPEEASKAYADLGNYSAKVSEAEMTERIHPEQLTKNYQDLDKYVSKSFDSVDKTYPTHPEQATKNYKDLDHYGSLFLNEKRTPSLGHHYGRVNGTTSGNSEISRAPKMDNLDGLTAQDIRADIFRKVRDDDHNDSLEGDKVEHESSWDIAANEAKERLQQTKTFHSGDSQVSQLKSSSSSDPPGDENNNSSNTETQAEEHDHDGPGAGSMDQSFPSTTFKAESEVRQSTESLSEAKEVKRDALFGSGASKSPVNSDDWLPSTTPLVVKHYRVKQTTSEESTSPNDEVTTYKMLAYDSSSDVVRIANTTSGANESSQRKPSSDLILNLTNPAKFFPHISKLQKQGYEMVSGNKDVLILRKVRESTVEEGAEAEADIPRGPRINPIDLMGRPAAGNFTSPTGFVNYEDMAEPITNPRTTQSRSQAEKYTQDPVLGNEGVRGGRRKKRSLGKKLFLGVAWTAGAAYAAGVMAEYIARAG